MAYAERARSTAVDPDRGRGNDVLTCEEMAKGMSVSAVDPDGGGGKNSLPCEERVRSAHRDRGEERYSARGQRRQGGFKTLL